MLVLPTAVNVEHPSNIKSPILNIFSVPLAGDLLRPEHVNIDFEQNLIRGGSVCFSEKAVQDACKRLNLNFIVRAHQAWVAP
ncbi:unnamed protein product [Bursaphelenchus okinawaensis]|uniref:Uncharacterized protein n=1 Tax=Bursaphelenchus okinawaensis TaxID=465554 RepID=A0A811KNH7_9BILA|nr:unnamed protein product [Bursaphelenchus okinawaensis]CAG9107547.1 unnamed protein product [Bursaphelenchus okinawaensis]